MRWERLCALGHELPEVEDGIWYRTPALKVRGKGFVRLKEDGASVVLFVEDVDEQQFLVEHRPEVYFITDHYRGYAAVLARLSKLTVAEARVRLRESWRHKAPAKLAATLDGAAASPKAKRSR